MTLGENTRVVAQRLGTAVEQINKTLPPVEDSSRPMRHELFAQSARVRAPTSDQSAESAGLV
ncbi:MAG TPA: hypothetical protein VI256_04740 [Roseiarcus sp.]